jgi:hypothetical protein
MVEGSTTPVIKICIDGNTTPVIVNIYIEH